MEVEKGRSRLDLHQIVEYCAVSHITCIRQEEPSTSIVVGLSTQPAWLLERFGCLREALGRLDQKSSRYWRHPPRLALELA